MYSVDETKNEHESTTEEKVDLVETKAENSETESTNFEALYEGTFDKRITSGSLVSGPVVQIGTDYIMIDIGRKIDGQAPIGEFIGEDGAITCAVGQEVEVLVESMNTSKGIIRLSKEKAKKLKIWTTSSRHLRKTPISGARSRKGSRGGSSWTSACLRSFRVPRPRSTPSARRASRR
jgi:small subunit ribosomal protein S1